jgi:hypothetical protein
MHIPEESPPCNVAPKKANDRVGKHRCTTCENKNTNARPLKKLHTNPDCGYSH